MGFVRYWILGIAVMATGCGNPAPAQANGFEDDRKVIQVTSSNVQGKNIYIPGTIVVTEGKGQSLSIFNTTEMPHGFSIAGIGVQEILPPKTEHVVELPDVKGGNVYHIHCHLHPAHRTGTLLVLPGS